MSPHTKDALVIDEADALNWCHQQGADLCFFEDKVEVVAVVSVGGHSEEQVATASQLHLAVRKLQRLQRRKRGR